VIVPGGPRVVALGGGHGLAASLQAVRRYAGEVTAIVSSADDGGSSGRLRHIVDMPPPGDLRHCLVALGEADSLWGRVFEHRFGNGELSGHAVGNLLIAGLASVAGDFVAALDEAGRLVGTVGRVLPATSKPVTLTAETSAGRVTGQVAVSEAHGITKVSVTPGYADTPPAVLEALAQAEQIVIGPGSLYTSVLAVVVVPDIRDALERSNAGKVYVCNLRPQVPETEGYDLAAHVSALAAHGVDIDVVVWDPSAMAKGELDVRCLAYDLAREGGGHDPARLGQALSGLVG
jgi:uncharacterized cofD-like protein